MAATNDTPTAAIPPAGVNHLVLNVRDIETRQSSLEEIFVGLVREDAA